MYKSARQRGVPSSHIYSNVMVAETRRSCLALRKNLPGCLSLRIVSAVQRREVEVLPMISSATVLPSRLDYLVVIFEYACQSDV